MRLEVAAAAGPARAHLAALLTAAGCGVLFGLAAGVSPAAAALRYRGGAGTGLPHWPGLMPVVTALCLAAVAWTAAAMAAARRDGRAAAGG